jgi:peptidyl-prolyl cis-trans isomerase C
MRSPAARPRLTAALCCAVLTTSACGLFKRDSDPKPGVTKQPPADTLATVGPTTITTTTFKAVLLEQPAFGLARYKIPEHKKEFLDGLIRNELLLQEAHRRNLENDPEVRTAIEKLLIHKLTETYLDERQKNAATPDADLHRYYDQHLSDFVTPTRVRVSHLFLAASENDPRRPRVAAEAARLLRDVQAREARGEKQALELTASQRSEDLATKATGGDLGFRSKEELTQGWGPTFAEAALALKTPGQLGAVIATDRGLHLIKLLGRHEGFEVPFDSAKATIETRLKLADRSHLLDDLTADLKKKTKVEINEKLLSQVDVTLPPDVASVRPPPSPTGVSPTTRK